MLFPIFSSLLMVFSINQSTTYNNVDTYTYSGDTAYVYAEGVLDSTGIVHFYYQSNNETIEYLQINSYYEGHEHEIGFHYVNNNTFNAHIYVSIYSTEESDTIANFTLNLAVPNNKNFVLYSDTGIDTGYSTNLWNDDLFNVTLTIVTFSEEAYNDYTSIYQEGYVQGYQQGSTDTREDIESDITGAYNEGYSDGLSEGLDTGHITEIFTNILNIGVLPINVLLEILNFEVFGINIGGFVTGLLTISIILIITRTIFNGGGGGKE